MKKLLFALFFIAIALSVNAQSSIINNSNCDIRVELVCVSFCPYLGYSSTTPPTVYTVSGMSTTSPITIPTCGTGSYVGALVSYANPLCFSSTMYVAFGLGTPPNPSCMGPFSWGGDDMMQTCGDCTSLSAQLDYDAGSGDYTLTVN